MSNNQPTRSFPSLAQSVTSFADEDIPGHHDQPVHSQTAVPDSDDSEPSQGGKSTVARNVDDETDEREAISRSVPSEDNNMDVLTMTPYALRVEALRLMTISARDAPAESRAHRSIDHPNSRLAAVGERLKQLVGPGENADVQLMNQGALRVEGLRLMLIASAQDDGQGLADEDLHAINLRSDAVDERLKELRLPPSASQSKNADVQLMSLDEVEEEYDRLVDGCDKSKEHSPEELDSMFERLRAVTDRQAELCHFPPDHNEEVLGEGHKQYILLSSGTLPRFLFRGSNARSGGNDSDSESSDDGSAPDAGVPSARMINEEDRIVPHAHFADPQLLNHPRRQTFDALQKAADSHVLARRFNTPFTSWTCDFETAVYFAIGHFPDPDEAQALEEKQPGSGRWVFHDADMPAEVAVIDTWTLPDRHLRVFHQPALVPDVAIPSEYLIYGALDRADGVDLRGVSVQELRARLKCPQWPRCPSRDQLPHRPSLHDVSDAWTIARSYMQDDEGGEDETIDLGLVVLAAELSRQQWQGFAPRPDIHVAEGRVQIQWPAAWMHRIRRLVERISPGPLGARMSGVALANAGTPYVGFPQFKLMQQLLLSWVMDYPCDPINRDASDDDDGSGGGEGPHVIVPPVHSCTDLALLASLTDLELATYWSQMVKRDRDGDLSVPPPGRDSPDQNKPAQSAEDLSIKDLPIKEVCTGDVPAEDSLIEATVPTVEVAVQTQQPPEQQHQPVEGDKRELAGPQELEGTYLPQAPHEQAGVPGYDYQQWGEEMPVTFCNMVILFVVFLLLALYLFLVSAVY